MILWSRFSIAISLTPGIKWYETKPSYLVCENLTLLSMPRPYHFLWLPKSLMVKWLEQVSRWHEVCCHDLEVMSLNPDWFDLGVDGTSVQLHVYLNQKPLSIENVSSYSTLAQLCYLCYPGINEGFISEPGIATLSQITHSTLSLTLSITNMEDRT